MSAVLIPFLIAGVLISNSIPVTNAAASVPARESSIDANEKGPSSDALEFERLRIEGNDAVYSLDYKTAREIFTRMTKLAPEHPAGYVYLANNLWRAPAFDDFGVHRRWVLLAGRE